MSAATGLRPWVLAARPATLWAGIAPVIVAGGLARGNGFRWDALAASAVVAVALQIGVNFANDVADAARGADTSDRVGPARAVASGLISPERMRLGIAVMFGTAAAAGLYIYTLRGWPVIVIGAASMVAALGYTGGPVPYGYRALGELFVLVFFGFVATVGTYYAHTGAASSGSWFAGAAMGFLAAAILVANNVRDMATDAAAGKRTLAVVLGRSRNEQLFAASLAAAFASVTAAVLLGDAPAGTLLALLAIPLTVPLAATLRARQGRALIPVLEGTARLQLFVAVLYATGAIVFG
jgi:1,4-dihydroxy-2-naphthoate octaprenyltransferase